MNTTAIHTRFEVAYSVHMILGIKIGLSASLTGRPYFSFCSSFEGTTKRMRQYNGGGVLTLQRCMYILVY